MHDTPASDSLAQRLVVDRVAAPGILDRRTLQRAQERHSSSASAHLLDRLHRRIAPAATSSESLPLVRIDRSAEPDGASSTHSADGASLPVAAVGNDRAAARPPAGLGATSSFVGDLVARQTPGIARTSELVARRVANAPGLIGGARATSRLLERSEHLGDTRSGGPVAIAAGVAPRVVQRVADSSAPASSPMASAATPSSARRVSSPAPDARVVARAGAAAGSATPSPLPSVSLRGVTRASTSLLSRKADSPTPTPVASALPVTTASSNVSTADASIQSTVMSDSSHAPASLPRASVSNVTRPSTPLLWRKVDAATRTPVASARPVTTASPTIGAASAQLVLRKWDVAAAPNQPPLPAPTISTSSTDVIARTAAGPHSAPSDGGWAYTNENNIDWIADQVGQRLARRLEIERERMGVRKWRQIT